MVGLLTLGPVTFLRHNVTVDQPAASRAEPGPWGGGTSPSPRWAHLSLAGCGERQGPPHSQPLPGSSSEFGNGRSRRAVRTRARVRDFANPGHLPAAAAKSGCDANQQDTGRS